MNLLGLKNSDKHSTLTLDKINKRLRIAIKKKDIKLTIIQEHSESRAVSYLHNNRNRYDHIIISPGAWNHNGYILLETLLLIKVPFYIINTSVYKTSVFNSDIETSNIFIDDDYVDAYIKILESL